MYHTNRNGEFFLGALVGASIATLTTLLFTTKKGIQLKDKVVEKYHQMEDGIVEAKDKAADALHDAKEKVADSLHDAKDKAEDAAKKGAQKLKKDE